jgi:hypothetical protein
MAEINKLLFYYELDDDHYGGICQLKDKKFRFFRGSVHLYIYFARNISSTQQHTLL